MKTKIIPFDLETAKKIQAGEIEGIIKTKRGNGVRILCFDLIDPIDVSFPIVCALYSNKYVNIVRFTKYGRYSKDINSDLDLVLEVPDNEPQFKPFDKVLCRDNDDDVWKANLFSHEECELSYPYYVCGGNFYKQCIPYEGNEELVGTTKKPK